MVRSHCLQLRLYHLLHLILPLVHYLGCEKNFLALYLADPEIIPGI
jgi:hypothetical protein